MLNIEMFVGIDVSKNWLDFAVISGQNADPISLRVANTRSGIQKALLKIAKIDGFTNSNSLFCLEHTGIYCQPFLVVAADMKLRVGVESAWKIKRTQSPRGKSDKVDAIRIADYAQRFCDRIRIWSPEPDSIQAVRQLLSVRERLIKAKNMLKVPMQEARKMKHSSAAEILQKCSLPAIKAIEKQIDKTEQEIDALMTQHQELKKNLDLLTSIPGIGKQTALAIILFTANFEKFDCPKRLACYSGVAPFENSSGTSIRGRSRVSHYANKNLKQLLHMAALAAIRFNPDLSRYFKRKVEQGKHKMSVVNAVRNKLIHYMFAVVKRGTPWIQEKAPAKDNFVAVS